MRSSVSVAVAQQHGEGGEPRVDLLAAVRVVTRVEPASALDAQAGTIGAAEGVHRLGQRQLVVEDPSSSISWCSSMCSVVTASSASIAIGAPVSGSMLGRNSSSTSTLTSST